MIAARSHGDESPSGGNLEYEPEFTQLMLAAQPEEERQAGKEIIPGAEPDAKKITECALVVLEKSNDIRAAVLYGYAGLRLVGFPGLAEATGFIRTCLEDFWDSAHPQLDADDDDDPTMRVNSVLGLVDPAMMLRAARLAPLTQSQAFGRMSLRDLAIVEGEIAAPEEMDNPPTERTLSAAFQDTPPEVREAIHAAIVQAAADIVAINAVFDTRIPGQGPTLDALAVLLKKAQGALAPYVSMPDEAAAPEPDAADDAPGPPAAPIVAAASPPGVISSRADVEKALDRIIAYYAEYEPSSPLPILLRRARRLIGADFLAILEDLAPLGLDNAKLIAGTENPE